MNERDNDMNERDAEKAFFENNKRTVIKELARLEKMDNYLNDKAAATIYPYVILEAINLLVNSKIVDDPKDYTQSGLSTDKMVDEMLKGL